MPKRESGNTLASLMVVALIILVAMVAWMLWPRNSGQKPRADGLGITTPGLVRAKALDTNCQTNLQQVRQAIEVFRIDDEESPITFEALRLPAESLRCPIGKEPYYLDENGKVHCPHPGHEAL